MAQVTTRPEATRPEPGQSDLIRIVVTYIATVIASFGAMLALMKHGW